MTSSEDSKTARWTETLVEELKASVRSRDAGQMQFCIHRLAYLGVRPDRIQEIVEREAERQDLTQCPSWSTTPS